MSGPEHYTEAEKSLSLAANASDRGHDEDARFWHREAQVHATLALAASAPLADIVGILTAIRDEIAQLPSSGRPA